MNNIRHFVLALWVAAAGLPAAFGQPVGYPLAPPPSPVTQPPPQTSLSSGLSLPSTSTLSTAPSTYPPAVYNPYGYSYQGRLGGALSGAADVIGAQGEYLKQQQQSRMLQTQADSSRIGYRQQLLQEARYEKSITPSAQEMKEREAWNQLQTARNNPSQPDIWSGAALNSLLVALQGAAVQGLKADPVPLSAELLSHMNFTTGAASGAGAGMLKDFNNLQWPFALQLPPFQDSQKKISELANQAVREIKDAGRVTAETFTALNTAVNTMNTTVNANQTLERVGLDNVHHISEPTGQLGAEPAQPGRRPVFQQLPDSAGGHGRRVGAADDRKGTSFRPRGSRRPASLHGHAEPDADL